jgi:hypothetical protein
MSAWREDKSRDDLTKGDFKLPHHAAASPWPTNLRATQAAIGAILGARGGVDIPEDEKEGSFNHLARHLTEDFDREPPEFRSYEADELKAFWEAQDEAADASADYAKQLAALEQAEAKMVNGILQSVKQLSKQGRVISAANENRLRQASELLSQVLGQLQSDDAIELDFELETPEEFEVDFDVDKLAVLLGEKLKETVFEQIVTPLTGRVL